MEQTGDLDSEALRIWQKGLEKGVHKLLDQYGQVSFNLSEPEAEKVLFPVWEETVLAIFHLFYHDFSDSGWSAMSKKQKKASANSSLRYALFHNQIMGSFKTYGRDN